MWVTVSAGDCRDRGGSTAAAVAAAPYLLTAAEATAYRRGRAREIVLLRAALHRHIRNPGSATDSSITPQALSRDGAAAAGLSIDDYVVVVSRVDSALRLRSASRTTTPDAAGNTEWAELDSLRVELTVLRSRLEAVGTGSP